jgi:hypothetical protein
MAPITEMQQKLVEQPTEEMQASQSAAADQVDEKKPSSQVESIHASKKRMYNEISGGPVAEESVDKIFKLNDGSCISSKTLSKKDVEQITEEIAKITLEAVTTVEVADAEAVATLVEVPAPVMEEANVTVVQMKTLEVTCTSTEEVKSAATAPNNADLVKEEVAKMATVSEVFTEIKNDEPVVAGEQVEHAVEAMSPATEAC